MIDVDGLIFEYPGTRALDGVSFAIPEASVTALVGPNGAGKTTLLRCLAALDRPLSGTMTVDGLDVDGHPRDIHARVGYLSDFFGLYENLTVGQCLTHRALAYGVAPEKAEAAAASAAKRTDIAELLERRASALSRGQRQRLAIAQAIVHRPKVLLLDEPASGLDPEARNSLSHLLTSLAAEGATLIVSSHILSELEDYSTHVLMLNEGRIADHRPLDGAGKGRVCLNVELVKPSRYLKGIVRKFDAAAEVTLDGRRASIVLAAGRKERRALLRHLIESGVAVCGFSEDRTRMQDLYLARLGRGKKTQRRRRRK